MASAETNVLFVPYRPHSSSSTSSSNTPVVSQQKHAAREYHRKAKLQRLANLDASQKRHGRSNSDQLAGSRTTRAVLPRFSGQSDEEDVNVNRKLSAFDVGTGEFDPFNACVPHGVPAYVLDMLEHAASHQWTVFSSSSASLAVGNIKNAILGCALNSPAAFNTIIFAGATHNAYSRRGSHVSSENKMLRLTYKTQAIKELNREIQNLQGHASDELLLCIITLAAHGSGEQLIPPVKEENTSPLATAQNFQYYGMMRWEAAHLKAIRVLIQQKGGLHTVKMPGLANAIGLADIFISFQTLNKPAFPLLAPTSLVMSTWPEEPNPLPPVLRQLTTGLRKLRPILTCEPLYEIMTTVRQITIGFYMYLSRQAEAPSLVRIVWARNSVQHDLLCLNPALPGSIKPEPGSPSTNTMDKLSITPIFSVNQSLYTLLRLSTLAYTLLVLFPLPRVAGLHAKLSQRLMLALDDCVVLDLWSTQPELLLWSTVLGGVVAGSDADANQDHDRETVSPTTSDTKPQSSPSPSPSPSPNPCLRSWFVGMAMHARTHIPSLSPATHSRYRDKDTKGKAARERDMEASWTIARDICASFLWFNGPEFEDAGRTFWWETC